jgi:hypothetical protein
MRQLCQLFASFAYILYFVNDRGIIEITKVDNPVIDVLKKAAMTNIYHW